MGKIMTFKQKLKPGRVVELNGKDYIVTENGLDCRLQKADQRITTEQIAAIKRLKESAADSTDHLSFANDWIKEAMPLIEALDAENERLKQREAKLKDTLLPVCEYAAEIYNRGIPVGEMPADTIQRLNWVFKMFKG